MVANLWILFEGQWVDGKYHLVQLIGVGGNGAVFLTDHVVGDRLVRRVALKLIPVENKGMESQLAEISVSVSLRYPSLLESYDAGLCNVNGVPLLYLVMEVADENLDKRMGGRLSAEDTRKIMGEVAAGLAYLHGRSEHYVHRDVKPSNILRVSNRWKLSDFGLTRGTGAQTGMTSHLQGTPEYAPPEAYEGILSSSGDIWSLGIMMSEMLTGAHPFPSSTPNELMRKVLDSPPVFPSPLPSPFDRLVPACLSKDRHERISAAQIVRELSFPESQTNLPSSFLPDCPQSSENAKTVNGLEFVRVPAGEFLYGEKKERTWLGEFWIMRCPVTVREYHKFCVATQRKMPDPPRWGWIDDHPMVNVTWHEASEFAQWAGCSLPTERQWEKAARGTDGREYPWGNTFDAAKCVCSVGTKNSHSTAPVGSFPAGPSPYGCLDMAGNVWEWCEDRYITGQNWRVLCGGYWNDLNADNFRAAFRISNDPEYTNDCTGFRIVFQGSG